MAPYRSCRAGVDLPGRQPAGAVLHAVGAVFLPPAASREPIHWTPAGVRQPELPSHRHPSRLPRRVSAHLCGEAGHGLQDLPVRQAVPHAARPSQPGQHRAQVPDPRAPRLPRWCTGVQPHHGLRAGGRQGDRRARQVRDADEVQAVPCAVQAPGRARQPGNGAHQRAHPCCGSGSGAAGDFHAHREANVLHHRDLATHH